MNIIFLTLLASAQNPATEGTVRNSAQRFYEMDPYGGAMAIIAMTVVFLALLMLYLAFSAISKYLNTYLQRKALKKKGITTIDGKLPEPISGEINAAIALAIYYYSENLHDMESLKLTIGKVSRTYSPWSSKIYGLRQLPSRVVSTKNLSLKVTKK